MNLVTQCERELNTAIRAAAIDPEMANLRELWQTIEPVLNQLTDTEQMQLAGTALVHLTDLHERKANALLSDWEEKYNAEGPPVSKELLTGLVQRTMHLDISDLIRKPHPRTQRNQLKPNQLEEGDSIAGVVNKNELMEFLETQSQETAKEQALAVAYEETITAWVEAIAQWFNQQPTESFPLTQIQQSLKMPFIQIWLALLLSNYRLEQKGRFYDIEGIWVSREPYRTLNRPL